CLCVGEGVRENPPPPCGEVEALSAAKRFGWGTIGAFRPPPETPPLRSGVSTSPQGGGGIGGAARARGLRGSRRGHAPRALPRSAWEDRRSHPGHRSDRTRSRLRSTPPHRP